MAGKLKEYEGVTVVVVEVTVEEKDVPTGEVEVTVEENPEEVYSELKWPGRATPIVVANKALCTAGNFNTHRRTGNFQLTGNCNNSIRHSRS